MLFMAFQNSSEIHFRVNGFYLQQPWGKKCRQSSYPKRSDSHLKPMLISQSKYFRHLKFLFDEQVSSWGQHEKYSKYPTALKFLFKFDQIILKQANKNALLLFTDGGVGSILLISCTVSKFYTAPLSSAENHLLLKTKYLPKFVFFSSREERELSSREDIISRDSKKLTFEKGGAYKSRKYPLHS